MAVERPLSVGWRQRTKKPQCPSVATLRLSGLAWVMTLEAAVFFFKKSYTKNDPSRTHGFEASCYTGVFQWNSLRPSSVSTK